MIKFQLVGLTGKAFDDDVYEVIIPTANGSIAVFESHMPLVSVAAPGVISVRRQASDADSVMEHFATMGGVIEVDGKVLRFLADDVARAEEIAEEEAEAAVKRARELIKDAKSQVALSEAQQLLTRNTVRLQVAKLKKRHHR